MNSLKARRGWWGRRGHVVLALVLALVASVLLGASDAQRASAAIGADFNPGDIISDAVFFDSGAMTVNEVQAFLSNKGVSCVAGEQACLKDYTTTTVARVPDGLCQGYQGGLVQSAAQIVAGVAGSCGISPKVLLVLMEKEQSLVSRTRPTTLAYRTATGFGCPDTAACDTQYYGYFNQVYSAARQYQNYAENAASFRYKAGKLNSIYYHPNPACGASNVFIANQATAGLYNYTPYQPNASALANLYGSGDACGAYGNRNFWRIFSDWFGDPHSASYLLRTPESAAVYVVSGTSKYLIEDLGTLEALAPLGPVGYVSQQYLDRRVTQGRQGRVVASPSGGVYFVDAGMKLPFGSCGQVAEFGASCDSLVRWEQSLVDALVSGPPITPLYRTTSGKAFYVAGGVKREVVDDAALSQAGLATSGVRLLESGLAYLPYGTPVTRDGVVLQNRSTGGVTLSLGGGFTTVSEGVRAATALSTLPVRPLDAISVSKLSPAMALGALVRESSGTRAFLLTERGKRLVADSTLPVSVPVLDAAVLALLPDAGTLEAGTFVKGSAAGGVYVLQGGARRTVGSWGDLVALAGGVAEPPILTVDQRVADLLPVGPDQLSPGGLVHSPRSGAVFFVDDAAELVPVWSFSTTNELGATRVRQVADAAIDAYTVRGSGMSTAIDCGGNRFLGLGGKLYPVGAEAADAYRLSYTAVDPMSCGSLPKASMGLTRFLRADSGAIYYIEAGAKRPIRSYNGYLALGGTSANTIQTSDFALSLLPTGTAK